MTPEQALDLLDRMVAMVPASRFDHANAQQALMILQAALTPEATPDGNSPDE